MTTYDLAKIMDQPIVDFVWRTKYRFGEEESIQDSFKRVVAGVYARDVDNQGKAYDALRSYRWSPGGRQHAGAGTGLSSTLINCYVSPTIQDSMRTDPGDQSSVGILDALSVAALTQQMGGGIGMDFSTLRPRGAAVQKLATEASGPLAFMDMWNSMCSTIMAAGTRRGAMMATLADHHPDIEEFIDAKHEKGRLTNFNVSILISDDFMKALDTDDWWDLWSYVPRLDRLHYSVRGGGESGGPLIYVYKRVRARDLWQKIMRSTYDYAEPGVIFIDTVNRLNNLSYCEEIRCSNPCGEQMLPPNGDCNLGAVNLAVMVNDPFTSHAVVDYEAVRRTVRVGMRWLDNVIDVSLYPTMAQKGEGQAKRRTGLGITGLANMLQQLGLRYGSPEAVEATRVIMKMIAETAYDESAQLAAERGPFPKFDRGAFLRAPFVRKLRHEIRAKIEEVGIRNGVLLTIAPTGTTSLYYGNVSSGLEPTFAWKYQRKALKADGTFQTFDVEDFGYRLYKLIKGETADFTKPSYMVTAQDLSVDDHLAMQTVCQEWIDSSVSKTINVPQDYPYEDFKRVYLQGYNSGLKGLTTYRPNPESGRGSVLEVKGEGDDAGNHGVDSGSDGYVVGGVRGTEPNRTSAGGGEQPAKETAGAGTANMMYKPPRPRVLSGKTYKIKWPHIQHAFYVTINDDGDRPFEMFINSKSVQHQEWVAALTRTVSAVFRRGGDVSFLVEELEQVHSATGGAWIDKEFVPSLVALIGKVIEEHLAGREMPHEIIATEQRVMIVTEGVGGGASNRDEEGVTLNTGELCPKCELPTLVHREGCATCLSCGYSNCG